MRLRELGYYPGDISGVFDTLTEQAVQLFELTYGTMQTGIATVNLQEPDPELDLDYIPNHGRAAQVEYAMSDSLGFGGHNACVVFKRWEG